MNSTDTPIVCRYNQIARERDTLFKYFKMKSMKSRESWSVEKKYLIPCILYIGRVPFVYTYTHSSVSIIVIGS